MTRVVILAVAATIKIVALVGHQLTDSRSIGISIISI